MSDWRACEFCGEMTSNEGGVHHRCLEPYIQKLKRQADHFRHLATDTVAAQPGQYEILGPLSEEVRTYTSIPVEELEELKAKAAALDDLEGLLRKEGGYIYPFWNNPETGLWEGFCYESLEGYELVSGNSLSEAVLEWRQRNET